ncbi:MAG TPA: hypothetical protein VNK26_07330, partial [Pyrinomonadaceae bacterium]|nr:hypothetical protein [Pyrinomonadaceae bacterium]
SEDLPDAQADDAGEVTVIRRNKPAFQAPTASVQVERITVPMTGDAPLHNQPQAAPAYSQMPQQRPNTILIVLVTMIATIFLIGLGAGVVWLIFSMRSNTDANSNTNQNANFNSNTNFNTNSLYPPSPTPSPLPTYNANVNTISNSDSNLTKTPTPSPTPTPTPKPSPTPLESPDTTPLPSPKPTTSPVTRPGISPTPLPTPRTVITPPDN